VLPFRTTLLRAAGRFALGGCLTASFYHSPRLRAYTKSLEQLPLSASLVYSSVMAQYAPADIPMLLDMVDVDSEKWLEYGRMRRPGPVYSAEGRRLREVERRITAQASCTVVSTHQERDLVTREFSPERVITVENGVDFEFFDPARAYDIEGLRSRQFIVFIGAMSYYPNVDAVQRFTRETFGRLKKNNPELEFLIVGHNPSSAVTTLAGIDGVTVTGSVEDVRRYLAAARAVVAPLRIARGIQNKVLEGLAMGKAVLATSAVCRTFGAEWPNGVLRCDSPEEYQKALGMAGMDGVRHAAYARFSWASNIGRLGAELRRLREIHKSHSSTVACP
jgi:polysaccharide biosynthesis protein PslH